MGFAVVNAAPDSLAADAAGSAAQTSIGFPDSGGVDDPPAPEDRPQPTSPAADTPRARTPKVTKRTSFRIGRAIMQPPWAEDITQNTRTWRVARRQNPSDTLTFAFHSVGLPCAHREFHGLADTCEKQVIHSILEGG
jgi:hypothetical protein